MWQRTPICPSARPSPKSIYFSVCSSANSDIGVWRKTASLLNSLFTPSVLATQAAVPPCVRAGYDDPPARGVLAVHSNSHASIVASPPSVVMAHATLRALRAHGLIPVVVQELREPTPYWADIDEGNRGFGAYLQETLARYASESQRLTSTRTAHHASIIHGKVDGACLVCNSHVYWT